jgi:HK97 family phage major capsid protein
MEQRAAIMDRATAQAAPRLHEQIENSSSEDRAPVIRIPARARRTGNMTAFANTEEGERQAYASGQWLRGFVGNNANARQWCREHGVVTNAMGEGDDLRGGNLVPVEFESAIVKRMEEYGVFPRYVRQTTMVSDQKTIPRRLSGLTVYFPGEAGTITDSDVTYNQVNLVAKKASTLTKISNELSEDAAIAVANEVADEIAYAHAVKIDQIGFLGDATTTYAGITGLDNALLAGSVSTATSTTIGALTLTEAEACVAKLLQVPGIRPVWFVHSAIFWNGLARLQVAAGGNAVMDVGGGPQLQFLGYPVVFTQALSSAGTTGTTWGFIGDLSLAATMGMRRGVSIASDPSVYFASDQIGIRSTYRYDINIHEVGTASVGGPVIKCKLG